MSWWDDEDINSKWKNEELEGVKSIVFDGEWQLAVLGHIIKNHTFFMKSKAVGLDAGFFATEKLSKLCDWMYKFHNQYGKNSNVTPTFQEIHAEYILREVNSKEEIEEYKRVWNKALVAAGNIRIETVKKNMTNFLRSVNFIKLIRESTKDFNNQKNNNFEQIVLKVQDKTKKIYQISFEDDGTYNFDNIPSLVKNLMKSRKEGIHTGHYMLDELLVSENETVLGSNGKQVPAPGLKYGDTTMLMGPLNSGKTTAMITFVSNAIRTGKHVLYLTHEMGQDDIALRLIYSMMRRPKYLSDKRLSGKDPEVSAKEEGDLNLVGMMMNKFLKYRPYNMAGGMYVEDVIAIIKMLNEEQKAAHGRGFDMIVDDYPAKLSSRAFATKYSERRHEEEYIYDQFVQLAIELNCHCLLGVQTNRDGFKKSNKGQEIVTVGDVSESFGVMRIASNVITINRSQDDKLNNTVTLFISKSRSNKTETMFITHTDMATGVMFSDKPLEYEVRTPLIKNGIPQRGPDQKIIEVIGKKELTAKISDINSYTMDKDNLNILEKSAAQFAQLYKMEKEKADKEQLELLEKAKIQDVKIEEITKA